jgi:acyl-CoA synthetase (NDP forming)
VGPFWGKVYPTVLTVPEKIDLAVIATRAEVVPEIMKDCIKVGVKGHCVSACRKEERICKTAL